MRRTLLVCGLLAGVALTGVWTSFAAENDWPRWRGPSENGMARGDAPTEWGDSKNIAWKLAIPGRGFSSPVVSGDLIFLTTAVPTGPEPPSTAPAQVPQAVAPPAGNPGEARPAGGPGGPPEAGPGGPRPGGPGQGPGAGRPGGGRGGPGGGSGAGREYKFVLMAIDRKSGKVLWERTAASATPHEGYHARYGSFASNSPVTDGKLVFALFGSRGVYAYDMSGKLVWQKPFSPMKMKLQFGEGAAPAMDDDNLYLKFDQEQGSFLVALAKKDGREVWRAERADEQTSWSQPLLLTHEGKKQLVVTATTRVRSYDPATGKAIWEVAGLGANVIPAPVTGNGMVYAMSGFRNPNLLAIKLGREGDLTGTDAIAWTNDRGNSYTASPVLHDGRLYFITDNGMITSLNALTGEVYYRQQRLPKTYNVKASPVGVNGKLYFATEEGDVVVVKMGEKPEVLATNTLTDQTFIATPAIAGGSLYLRSSDALYCIREK